MKLSRNGIDLIKSFEGVRLESYKALSTEEYFTIGYGHYGIDVKENQKITLYEAEQLLKKDLERFESCVNNFVLISLTQNQFDSLVSFVYNVGVNAFRKSTLLELINQKKFKNASLEFDKWINSGGQIVQGLVKRRNKEKELFLKGMKTVSKAKTKNYRIKFGESLSLIAQKQNTTVETLMKLNPSIKHKDTIYTNQIIKIPLN